MGVCKYKGRCMYWSTMGGTIFPDMDLNAISPLTHFEDILRYMSYSASKDPHTQIMDFLSAVNSHLITTLIPGKYITLDESMIKAFHRDLKGKMKIKRKPRPIGNEIKDLADASSNIVIQMELYEGKEDMAEKEHVKKLGATCATSLRLTKPYHGSGRTVIGDSWFGSVKTACHLRKEGLHSILIVKTAHKEFPVDLLNSHTLKQGQWVSYTRNVDGTNIMATSYMDLKKKQFVSTCSTTLHGKPRVTKHGIVQRPKVAETYLQNAAAIDIHNHVRTGSLGCEDVLLTKSPQMRQFSGIIGFLFTNAYLAFKKFKHGEEKTKHVNFKVYLSTALCRYKENVSVQVRSSLRMENQEALVASEHKIEKLKYPKRCFFCYHGYQDQRITNTTFMCSYSLCNKPICKPSSTRKCWELHLQKGQMPEKRYKMK